MHYCRAFSQSQTWKKLNVMTKISGQHSLGSARFGVLNCVAQETTGCKLGDIRRDKRFARVVADFWRSGHYPVWLQGLEPLPLPFKQVLSNFTPA